MASLATVLSKAKGYVDYGVDVPEYCHLTKAHQIFDNRHQHVNRDGFALNHPFCSQSTCSPD
jgi:hypothetical protein